MMKIEVTEGVIAELNAQIELFRYRCMHLAKEKEDAIIALNALRGDLAKSVLQQSNAASGGLRGQQQDTQPQPDAAPISSARKPPKSTSPK